MFSLRKHHPITLMVISSCFKACGGYFTLVSIFHSCYYLLIRVSGECVWNLSGCKVWLSMLARVNETLPLILLAEFNPWLQIHMCTCQCILYSHLCIVSLVTLIGFVRCRHILHGYLYVVPSVTFMGFVTVCLFSYGCMLFISSGRENENHISGKPCIWL